MKRLPFDIARRLRALFVAKHRPLCLVLDETLALNAWWGELADYGLEHLKEGDDCGFNIDFLVGYNGRDSLEFPLMETANGRVAHVSVIPSPGWVSVILLDAKEEHARQREVQQKANEVSLLSHQQQKLAAQLREVGEELEVRRREAEAASQMKSRFIAGMSHEFRTPLTSILGYSELLQRRLEGQHDLLDILSSIERGAKHLLFLVENLLDQARIEAGGIHLSPAPTRVRKLFTDLQELFEPLALKAGLKLRVSGVEQLPAVIECDELRLKQILINLISNACKYTKEGGVAVSVSWDTNASGSSFLEVAVRDTGPGIPEEHQTRIFRDFQRLANDGEPGAGLGLAIAKHLVTLMKGTLKLKSTIGVGSIFTLRIPVKEMERGASALDQTLEVTDTARLGLGKTVLVAEDNQDIVDLIRIFLLDAGYQVVCAEDGQAAVDLALQHVPDLVLMDVNMPVLDGNSATRALRDADYRQPILALTASNSMKDRQMAKDAGCDDYVLKPIDMPNLLQIVGKYTENCDAV
jgi:signal transduction histidine kinase/ActR/RegA family two-component response regulator